MSHVIIGVDPGITGALACIDNGQLIAIEEMPVHDGRADGLAISELVEKWRPNVVYLENTQAMPKNGSVANYSLGLNTGVVIGAVMANLIPIVRVRPQQWKKKMGLTGKDKTASRGLARELFPAFAESFRYVRNDGLAEACLIARYGSLAEIHAFNEYQLEVALP